MIGVTPSHVESVFLVQLLLRPERSVKSEGLETAEENYTVVTGYLRGPYHEYTTYSGLKSASRSPAL